MSKKTKFLKRGLAFLLAMIIALGSAMTAFAATSRTTWNGHNRFKVNGNDAYCIDFSAVSASSGSVSSTAYKTWNNLPSANKKKIELAITAAHNLGYYNSSDVKYFGVQYYIWMCSCKSAANTSLSNWFKNEVKPYYDNVDKEVNRLWSIGVDFTDDRTLTNTKTSLTLTDEKNNFKNFWKISSVGKGSKTGNALSVTPKVGSTPSNNRIVFSTTASKVAQLSYGSSETYNVNLQTRDKFYKVNSSGCYMFGNQAVVYGTGVNQTVSFNINVKNGNEPPPLEKGYISVQKKLDANTLTNESDVVFYVRDSNGNEVTRLTTNSSGYAISKELSVGKYMVVEDIPEGTMPSDTDVHYVTVEKDKTVAVVSDGYNYVRNVAQAGDFLVHKVVNDIDENGQIINGSYSAGSNGTSAEGFEFNLSGTSEVGLSVNMNSVTDENGNAYFCNVPVGTYELKEVTTETDKYIYAGDKNTQTIEIKHDKQTSYDEYCTTNPNDFQSIKKGNGTGENNYSYVNETGVAVFVPNEGGDASDTTVNNISEYSVDTSVIDSTDTLEELVSAHLNGKEKLHVSYNDADLLYNSKDNTVELNILKSYYELKYNTEVTLDENLEEIPTGNSVDDIILDISNRYNGTTIVFDDVVVTVSNGVITVTPISTDTSSAPDSEYDSSLKNDASNYTSSQLYFNYVNAVKSFRVSFQKADSLLQTSSPIGNATLQGAVYGLYRTYNNNTKLVGTYQTDENGRFTTEPYVVIGEYYIQEITASEGYMVDTNKYVVFDNSVDTSNWGSATKTLNTTTSNKELVSYEEVKSASINIYKYTAYDDEMNVTTPEENAEFEIYLKTNGSYANSPEYERDYVKTDTNGYVQTKSLPYGTYVIHQTKVGDKNSELCEDTEVTINGFEVTAPNLINIKHKAYVNVVKKDADTGNIVPVSGATFRIYRADENGNFVKEDKYLVSFEVTYPQTQTIYDFYTDETGSVNSPARLECGDYYLVETKAPAGYKLDQTPVKFTISLDTENEATINGKNTYVVYTEKSDELQMGKIAVYKIGDVFSSVLVTEDGFKKPVFSKQYLANAEFNIVANTDIYAPDGTLKVSKGTVVDTVTTNTDGVAYSKDLYINASSNEPEYVVVETKAPYGYALDNTKHYVDLSFDAVNSALGMNASATALNVSNTRQNCTATLTKTMEKDELYKIGFNGEVQNVYFGLYAKEDLVALDGSVINAGDLIDAAYVTLNENAEDASAPDGTLTFTTDIPIGHAYYIKEIYTDNFYVLNDSEYEFTFDTNDSSVETLEYVVNNGMVIENKLARGKVTGVKTDVDGNLVKGAVYGLFSSDATGLTKETAITTAETDENGVFTFDFIPKGSYKITELSVPTPYKVSSEVIEFTIGNDNEELSFDVTDEFIEGSISVYKYDAEYPKNALSGAEFSVYLDVDNDGKYNSEIDTYYGTLNEVETGYYLLEGVRYGHYLIKETKAPVGFAVDDNYYPVFIEEDGVTYNVTNSGECFLNNALKGTLKIVKTSSNGVVEGFTFNIKGKSLTGLDVDITETTDSNGEIVISDLRVGTYTITEVENDNTVNYTIPAPQEVTIKENETTTVNFYNEFNDPDNTKSPNTGAEYDLSNLALVGLASSFASSLAVVGSVVNKKKKGRNNK